MRRQEMLEQHVGAQVHMVVAVDTRYIVSVQPPKLVDLSRDDIRERAGEAGVKHHLREAMRS